MPCLFCEMCTFCCTASLVAMLFQLLEPLKFLEHGDCLRHSLESWFYIGRCSSEPCPVVPSIVLPRCHQLEHSCCESKLGSLGEKQGCSLTYGHVEGSQREVITVTPLCIGNIKPLQNIWKSQRKTVFKLFCDVYLVFVIYLRHYNCVCMCHLNI